MSDLAASIVMEAAALRAKRAHAKHKQAAKDSARHKRTNAHVKRVVARRRIPRDPIKPWNRLTPESEMQLFLCESVRQTLYRLECAEYEAKHGK